MPTINVSLKDGKNEAELEKAKQTVVSQGGKVTHEFTLIKGFTAEVPADQMSTMQTNEHVDVEEDKEMRTQV